MTRPKFFHAKSVEELESLVCTFCASIEQQDYGVKDIQYRPLYNEGWALSFIEFTAMVVYGDGPTRTQTVTRTYNAT